MTNTSTHWAGIAALAAACCLGLYKPRIANAQAVRQALTSRKAIELPTDSRGDFERAFTALSAEAHITIVAEGIPLHPKLADYQIAFLNDKLATAHPLTLQYELAIEAAQFDYDVVQQSANVFLLRKRYSDPMDLPNVTYDEIVHSLREICDLMGGEQDDDADPPQLKLYQSLTPEQKAQSSLNGLPISQLSPDQAAVAGDIPSHMLLRSQSLMLRQGLRSLLKIKDPRVVFGWMTLQFGGTQSSGLTAAQFAETGANPFGFYGPIGSKGHLVQQPLSAGFESMENGFTILSEKFGPPAAPGSPTPTEEDERMSSGMMANALPSTRTLNDAVLPAEGADNVGAAKMPAAVEVTVDSAIGPKPACIFGQRYCERSDFLCALAAIYDLRLSQPERGLYHLGPNKPETYFKVTGLAAEIRRLLPSPLIHSYRAQSAAFRAAGVEAQNQSPSNLALRAYYYPAVRRLLCLAEPAAELDPSETVPLQSLDPEASRLVAIIYFSSGQMNRELFRLLDFKAPAFLQDAEALCIRFQPARNNSLFVSLGTQDNSGAFQVQAAGEVSLPKTSP